MNGAAIYTLAGPCTSELTIVKLMFRV